MGAGGRWRRVRMWVPLVSVACVGGGVYATDVDCIQWLHLLRTLWTLYFICFLFSWFSQCTAIRWLLGLWAIAATALVSYFASPLPSRLDYKQIWRHPQNRKYTTRYNAAGEDRAKVTGNMRRKFAGVCTSGFWNMFADIVTILHSGRRTHRHASHTTLHSYRRQSNKPSNNGTADKINKWNKQENKRTAHWSLRPCTPARRTCLVAVD